MKSYNIKNYIRYKEDLEKSIKRIPEKEYKDYTRTEFITIFILEILIWLQKIMQDQL